MPINVLSESSKKFETGKRLTLAMKTSKSSARFLNKEYMKYM